MLLLAGCAGKNGATGPQGRQGSAGQQGVTGGPDLVISSLSATPNPLIPNRTALAVVNAYDSNGGTLTYTWAASNGWKVTGYGMTATITAPTAYNAAGSITVTVDNGSTSVTGTTILSTVTQLIINTFPAGYGPGGVAIDASGNVWVADDYNYAVSELSLTGTTMGGTFPVGSDPWGTAIDAAGNVWVANYGGTTVSELNSAGTLITTATAGNGPECIAIDASGNVWVTNYKDSTVSELSPTGTTITTVTVGTGPNGIAIDASGNVWVANEGDTTVSELSPTGTIIGGPFTVGISPEGVAIDASGNIWVVNLYGNDPNHNSPGTVTELSPDGITIATYTVGFLPGGLTIDALGDVWVTNVYGNNSYASNGGTVTEIVGVTQGPEYWPYTGPQFPGGGNLGFD